MGQQLNFDLYPMLNQLDLEWVKRLDRAESLELCQEIRRFLIEACSITGGHIGASLGTVELCLALHRVFNSPEDKFIFDVGHQAYAHKILTGRWKQFEKLRTHQGLSGFCRRDESIHDIFGAGHAGTALSAAMGILEAYHHDRRENKVVAIVGDGSMTNGMVYEAMNQISPNEKNLVVILNDNEMSIAPNVGYVSEFLSMQMASPTLSKVQHDLRSVLSKIPNIGDDLVQILARIKRSVKDLFVPTVLFESFGFKYIGPIDGHNLELLEETLLRIKQLEEPVLLHVITEKGKGYRPAEGDRETYHGCGPYEIETGKIQKAPFPLPYTKVFAETLTRLAKQDPAIVAITAAMPSGTGLKAFQKAIPDRFYDVGIAEEHAVTFAGGMATEGYKPVCAIYSTFLQRALDQVTHDIAIQNLNVTFAMDRAGLVGEDGETHQGLFDVAYLRMIPNMVSMAPKDEIELQRMLYTGIEYAGPASVRYPKGTGLGVPLIEGPIEKIALGTAEIVHYETAGIRKTSDAESIPTIAPGREFLEGQAAVEFVERFDGHFDIAFWALGSMVHAAMQASKDLFKDHGISSIVINARFIKPFDRKLLAATVKKASSLITIEESNLMGGFGSCVMEELEAVECYSMPIKRLGVPDRFILHAKQKIQRSELGLDPAGIAATARAFIEQLGIIHPPTELPVRKVVAGNPTTSSV